MPTILYRGSSSTSHTITTGTSRTFALTGDAVVPVGAHVVAAQLTLDNIYSFSSKRPFDVTCDGRVLGSRLLGDGSSASSNIGVSLTWDLDPTADYSSIYSVTIGGSDQAGASNIMSIRSGCGVTLAITYEYNKQYVLDDAYPEDATVDRGESVTLQVRVLEAGMPASPTYQWYKNGVVIEGANGDTLVVTPVTLERYYCVVTNPAGSVQSRTALVAFESGCSIKIGGVAVPASVYIYTNGAWQLASPYIYSDGAWTLSSSM